jgi:ribonuclease HI
MILQVNTDGGSLNNPGKAGIGFLIRDENQNIIYSYSEYIGIASNNVAEYTALIRALSFIKENIENKSWLVETIKIVADSELMIKQINGVYKVKNPDIAVLHTQVKKIVTELGITVVFTHVLREKNHEADALVKKALGR